MAPARFGSVEKGSVAVIIVSYNGRSYLEHCLPSVLDQSYRRFRVMVVDNGSVDGTVPWLRKAFPEVLVVPKRTNLGFARANNILIRRAMREGFDFVVLLNQDTVVRRDFLAEGVKQLRAHSGIACPKILFAEDRRIFYAGGPFFDSYHEFLHRNLLDLLIDKPVGKRDSPAFSVAKRAGFASGCAFFFSREVVERIGVLDERYFFNWETKDYSKMARDAGFEVWYFPSTVVLHDTPRITSTSRVVRKYFFSKIGWWMVKGLLQYVRKHFGFWRMVLFAVKAFFSIPFIFVYYLRHLRTKT